MKAAVWDFVKTVLMALVIAILITSFIKPTLVKGYSMYPTIQPNSYMIVNKIPYIKGMPAHGDIIVFKAHIYMENGEEKDLIKRVIGIAGDRISVSDGIVYRNGKALEEDYIYGGVTPGEMDETIVEKNCIFVMGDNRGNSLDSRDPSIGQVAIKDILGKVVLRLYPFDEVGFL